MSSARASWPSAGLVMSDHCLRTTSSSRTSGGATTQPRRRAGASVFDTLPR